MNTSSFARIRNAKALLLTSDKRVMHFPATNKVRIDNILPDNPNYKAAARRASVKEYENASKAASTTGLVPPVQNYRERGNMTSYTQDYAGKPLPDKLEGISPKEQYKIGSQVGRMQNRLYEKGMGHMDIHEGNVVRPNPNKKQLKLVDNASVRPIEVEYDTGEMKNPYSRHWLGKPFMTGYNSRINFSQHKQMQHFAHFGSQDANFAPFTVSPAIDAAATRIGGALRGGQIGSAIGTGLGVAKGAGVFETEEERANTNGWDRAAKTLGYGLAGNALGTGLGTAIGGNSRFIREKAEQGKQVAAKGYQDLNQKVKDYGTKRRNDFADERGIGTGAGVAAMKYKRGATPDPYANSARQSGQPPRPIEID
jgi:hypothetical protein